MLLCYYTFLPSRSPSPSSTKLLNISPRQKPANSQTHKPTTSAMLATDFAMPVQQFTASPSQYTLYNSQQISPLSSAPATPNDASPTSPRAFPSLAHLPAHTRQLRPPKSPLYVPAVLRPTEPPKRQPKASPLTPPHSIHNSFDDLTTPPLSRRNTGDDAKFGLGAGAEAEWDVEGLGKVTSLPTRAHWKVCQQFPRPYLVVL